MIEDYKLVDNERIEILTEIPPPEEALMKFTKEEEEYIIVNPLAMNNADILPFLHNPSQIFKNLWNAKLNYLKQFAYFFNEVTAPTGITALYVAPFETHGVVVQNGYYGTTVETARSEVVWGCGSIVHCLKHRLDFLNGNMDYAAGTGELRAIDAQLGFLGGANAPRYMINYLNEYKKRYK